MTANRLLEEIDAVRATGHLPLPHRLSSLIDMASECVDHFDDGRITLSFSIQVVLEALLERFEEPNSLEITAFDQLMGAMHDVAAELISPSKAGEMLGKSDVLIMNARKWLDASN